MRAFFLLRCGGMPFGYHSRVGLSGLASYNADLARFGGLFRATLIPMCFPSAHLGHSHVLSPLCLLMFLRCCPLEANQRVSAKAGWNGRSGCEVERAAHGVAGCVSGVGEAGWASCLFQGLHTLLDVLDGLCHLFQCLC